MSSPTPPAATYGFTTTVLLISAMAGIAAFLVHRRSLRVEDGDAENTPCENCDSNRTHPATTDEVPTASDSDDSDFGSVTDNEANDADTVKKNPDETKEGTAVPVRAGDSDASTASIRDSESFVRWLWPITE